MHTFYFCPFYYGNKKNYNFEACSTEFHVYVGLEYDFDFIIIKSIGMDIFLYTWYDTPREKVMYTLCTLYYG